jgi:hypothetical protein
MLLATRGALVEPIDPLQRGHLKKNRMPIIAAPKPAKKTNGSHRSFSLEIRNMVPAKPSQLTTARTT